MRYEVVFPMFLFVLSGCASVIEGRSQEITVNTDPSGATCAFERKGVVVGRVSPTPGTVYLEKTKDDISVTCSKAGYNDAAFVAKSGYPKYNWAYILVGGPIGWGIDSVTGADNEYTSPLTVSLAKR